MLFLPLLFQHVSEAWACPSTAWCVWSSRQHKKKKKQGTPPRLWSCSPNACDLQSSSIPYSSPMYSSPIFSLFSYNSIYVYTIHIDELPWAGLQCLSYIPSALNLLQCRRVPQLAQAPSTHAPKVCENNMDKVCWTKSVGQLYLCDQSVTMGRVSEGNANVESLLACISYTPFVHHGTIIWVPTKHKIKTFIQWRLQHVYHSAKPIWTLEWTDLTLATLLLTFGPQSPPFYIFYIILLHYPRISSCCFPSEPERHLDLPWAMGDYGSVIWLWYVGAVWYVICEFEWIWHYWVTIAN